jgi:drug/metabolite transporter (DMT)-like permease
MSSPREKLGLALGVASACLFGATLPATRLALESFDPFFVSTARAAIAGLIGLSVLLVLRRPWPSRAMLCELIVAGLCTIVAYPLLIAYALMTVPASHGGVVLGILPLATMAGAAIVTHERPSLAFWLASIAGSVNVLAFVARSNAGLAISHGDIFLLTAVVAGGGAYALSGRLSGKMPGWEVISWQVTLYLPVTVAATIWQWPGHLSDVTASAWAGFAYVSTVSMYLGFFVFNAAAVFAGVARVGQIMLLQPFFIVALSIPVNGEPFDPVTILFAAAVVATVVIGQRMRVRRG